MPEWIDQHRSFYIEERKSTGEYYLVEFDNHHDALMVRLRAEKLNRDPDIKVVSLISDSEETIRHTHSSWFFGERVYEPLIEGDY